MRVDFVITELSVGGAERCLTELALGLAKQGDQVRVFSLGQFPDGPQGMLVNRLRRAQIDVTSGEADSSFDMGSTYRRLRKWLDRSPPDVLQTFMYHANVIGTFAAKSSSARLRLGGLRVAELKSIRCAIERTAVNQMDGLICVSSAVAEFAKRQLKCDPARLHVIHNGVDVDRFSRVEPYDWTDFGWPADALVSVFVGRLHRQKGIELLQQQIDRLAPAGSQRRLLLVGDGPLAESIETWIAEVGTDRVKRLAWQPDVAPLIRGSRLLILPSRYEGMANVVLEAMASARPVVCSRVEGADELLDESIQAQGFTAGDADAMAELAERFLSDAEFSDAVGAENQSRARANFSIPKMVNAYRDLYRSLLERERR